MKRLALLALLLLAMPLHAQKPEKKPHPPHPVFNAAPVAAFTFTCTGLACLFVDGSSDSDGTITARLWGFGDGVPSTELNPAHTYGNGGTFTVALEVLDNGGLISRTTRAVTVTALPPPDTVQPNVAPVASFTAACAELACTFTDHSTDLDGIISTRTLDFGDATGTSGLAVSTHTYSVSGTYTATLEVCDDDGLCASTTRSVSAIVAPPATTYILAKTLGDDQTWAIGGPLPDNFRVLLTDAQGNPVAGDTIYWAVASGGGSLNRAFSVTDAFPNSLGWAYAKLTLGPVVGTQTATARHARSGLVVTFTATAQSTTPAPDTTTPPPPSPPPPDTTTPIPPPPPGGTVLAAHDFESNDLGPFTQATGSSVCTAIAGGDYQCSSDIFITANPSGAGRVARIRYPHAAGTSDVNRSFNWNIPLAQRPRWGQCFTFEGSLYIPTPSTDIEIQKTDRKLLYYQMPGNATNHFGTAFANPGKMNVWQYNALTLNRDMSHSIGTLASFFDRWHRFKISLRINSAPALKDGKMRYWYDGVEPVFTTRFVTEGYSKDAMRFYDSDQPWSRIKVGEQVNPNVAMRTVGWTEVRYWDDVRFTNECP